MRSASSTGAGVLISCNRHSLGRTSRKRSRTPCARTTHVSIAHVARIQARHAERERLLEAIAATEARQSVVINRRAVQERVQARADQWRAMLMTSIADGRQVLREVLRGPIRFTPDEATRGYRFEGPLDLGRLLSGVVEPALSVASLMPTSWNQVARWLEQIDGLRRAA